MNKDIKEIQEIVKKAKDEGKKVFSTMCGKMEFITTTLTREEYKDIMFSEDATANLDDIEEFLDGRIDKILEKSILYPKDWKDIIAKDSAHRESLADEIMELSGFIVESVEL